MGIEIHKGVSDEGACEVTILERRYCGQRPRTHHRALFEPWIIILLWRGSPSWRGPACGKWPIVLTMSDHLKDKLARTGCLFVAALPSAGALG